MSLFIKENFFPRNFILLGKDMDELKSKAEYIVSEAADLFPEFFNTERSVFPFEFRYTPPSEKTYGELKRLQGTVAGFAGRKSEYHGYILLDLNSFIKHEAENYFDMTIKFLADNNDCWNYIFIVDYNHSESALDLIQKILLKIHCKVIVENNGGKKAEKQYVQLVMEECGLNCTKAANDFFVDAISKNKISKEIAKTIILDVAGNKKESSPIDIDAIVEYLNTDIPTVRYMLSDEQFEDVVRFCKRVS